MPVEQRAGRVRERAEPVARALKTWCARRTQIATAATTSRTTPMPATSTGRSVGSTSEALSTP